MLTVEEWGKKGSNQNVVIAEDDMDDVEHSPEEADPNAGRFVRYQFTPQFLRLKHVGATYVPLRSPYRNSIVYKMCTFSESNSASVRSP